MAHVVRKRFGKEPMSIIDRAVYKMPALGDINVRVLKGNLMMQARVVINSFTERKFFC